jgi:hypothetical protein
MSERGKIDPPIYPPELIEQLRVFAVLAQFRLEYDRATTPQRPGPTGPKVPISFNHVPANWRQPLYWVEVDHSRVPKVRHEGIQVGEITGWRCWTWNRKTQRLHSMSTNDAWEPGGAMTGNVEDYWEGVHAWQTEEQARAYMRRHSILPTTVLGTVKMWGEMAEHGDGWRAENARIHELKDIKISEVQRYMISGQDCVLGYVEHAVERDDDVALLQTIRRIYRLDA